MLLRVITKASAKISVPFLNIQLRRIPKTNLTFSLRKFYFRANFADKYGKNGV